ncbi:MAG: hypothetical protein RR925_10340, partial [Erysipelotrichaceae bacterium]
MNLETIKKEQIKSQAKQAALVKQSSLLAMLRLVSFFVILLGVYFGYDKKIQVGYFISIFAIVIFIFLYIEHQKIKN